MKKTEIISIATSKDKADKIKSLARKERRTVSFLLDDLLEKYLDAFLEEYQSPNNEGKRI